MNNRLKSNILIGAGIGGLIFSGIQLFNIGKKHANLYSDKLISRKEKIKSTWKSYIPVAINVVTSSGAIIAGAIGLNNSIVATSTLVGVTQNALATYKSAVADTVSNEVKDEIQEKANKKAMDSDDSEPSPNDTPKMEEMMCYDSFIGRYFYSNILSLERAINSVNRDLMNYDACSLNEFYAYLDKDGSDIGDIVGWTSNEYGRSGDGLDIVYHYEKSKNGYPVLVFSYSSDPVYNFNRAY